MTVLVAYASKHGGTEGIARAIAERLTERGRPAEVRSILDDPEPGQPEAVVLGSAVYAGSWMKEATEYARAHASAFGSVPVWLFSSGPLGEDVEEEREEPKQLAELQELLGPEDHRVFYGVLDRGKLGFAERAIAKAVKAPQGDFRDWDEIRAWADGIAEELAAVG